MDEYESLSHTTWDCKYHVVFIPKCRRKTLDQELRRYLAKCFASSRFRRNRRSRKGI
jgi:putative transposase